MAARDLGRVLLVAILLIGLSGITAAAQETEDNPAPTVEDLVWDGRNEAGLRVSAGVYHYRIRASGFVDSHRIIHLK